MSKHIVVETHLEADESIHNPERVARHAAEIIKELVDNTYSGGEKEPTVKTLAVAYRVQDLTETDE